MPPLFPQALSCLEAETNQKKQLANLGRNDPVRIKPYSCLLDENFNPTVPTHAQFCAVSRG